jgi:hypothetical protein
MSRASSCPSSGAQQLLQPPLVYRWNVMVAVLLVVVSLVGPTTTNNTAMYSLNVVIPFCLSIIKLYNYQSTQLFIVNCAFMVTIAQLTINSFVD